ncbi:MAG: hypothetical protein LBV32_04090 [Tannerellaceae bacterium]|jgi:hypothetical protein|nr:hypothetical protein [Tannerellaceae bacterium]
MKQILIISFIAIAQLLSAGIRTYDYPEEAKPSGRFKLKAGGMSVLVMSNPIPCSFAAFEMQPNESVTVEIEDINDVKWVDVRPLSAGIKPVFKGNKITFTIPKTGNYSIEINGELEHPLFIFANPPEKKPAKSDPGVIYFEAGKIHTPGIIRPKSGQHIYIEGGAIVVGAIAAKNVENVKVSGHGILDGSLNNGLSDAETASMFSVGNGYKSTGKYQRFIEFYDSKNITIEGLILNNSTTWQVVPINCDRVSISRLKLISDNPSDDGIDIVRSRDVHVSDCFVRVKDDCVAIKAHLDYPDNAIVNNVLIENCVFWNAAWGNGLEIGFELHASEVKNITFRNCDVIHVESGAVFSIHNSDKATVSNILFEDIRVEDARHKLFDLAIFRSRYCTDGSSDQEYIAANYFHGAWDGVLKVPEDKKEYHAQFRGQIESIQFKNIYIYGIVPFSILSGFDEKHLVRNITFDNIVLNGRKASGMEELKLYTEYAEQVSLK